MPDRKTIQDIYIRVCRDSGFGLDYIAAAQLAAKVVGIHPLDIWIAMPSLSVMEEIATGAHPSVRRDAA